MKNAEITTVAEIEVCYSPKNLENPIINSCLDASHLIRNFMPENTITLKEQLVVLYLNQAQRIIGFYKISDGGLTSTVCDIRLILSIALKTLSTNFIIGHNHPSGNLNPSKYDIAVTLKLKEAAEIMDLKLTDHLIVSPFNGEYFSFANNGYL